jgi:hypothetical protein
MEILNPLSIARGNRLYESAGRIKSGAAVPGDFSGTPKKATVTFSTPYTTVAYDITLTAETDGSKTLIPTVEAKTVSGFDINLHTDILAGLVRVGWHTVLTGE